MRPVFGYCNYYQKKTVLTSSQREIIPTQRDQKQLYINVRRREEMRATF